MIAQVLSLDLRSLALFRICLATGLLADLASRAGDLTAHYTNDGLILETDLFSPDLWHVWSYAAALVGGSLAAQAVVFGIAAIAAASLLVGYRSRAACLISWALLTSIQMRNPFVNFGADSLLRMLLLWGCFLPLGMRWSVDSRFKPNVDRESWLSIGGVGLVAQVALVFFLAGLAKFVDPVWQAGNGVARAFDHELLATSWAASLRDFEGLCSVLTYATIGLELGGALLLFCPWRFGAVRTVTIFAMSVMSLCFNLGLNVGLFPIAGVVGLLALLPGWFWRKILRAEQHDSEPAFGVVPSRGLAWTAEALAAVILFYVLVWNIGLWRSVDYQAPPAWAWLGDGLRLNQRWGMFTRIPSTGYFVVPGKLRSGEEIDLLAAGGPLPSRAGSLGPVSYERPDDVPGSFKGMRWRVFFLGMTEWTAESERRNLRYGRYLCREWNERHTGAEQLDTLQVIYMRRPATAERQDHVEEEDYRRDVLWNHWCFG